MQVSYDHVATARVEGVASLLGTASSQSRAATGPGGSCL